MTNKLYSCCGRAALIVSCALLSSGCKLSDSGVTSHLPQDKFFAAFTLEHHAINLSVVEPYDTVTLKTVATMADGSLAPGEITYSVDNPALSVQDGILKANSAVAYAIVRVTQTHGPVTRTDFAVVSVTDAPPTPLGAFKIRVPETDSAKAAVGTTKTFALVRQSDAGDNLSGLHVSIRSSDTTIAKISSSGDDLNVVPVRPGRVMLYATTFAFGSERKDSLLFTVGWPLSFHLPTVETSVAGQLTKILDFTYQNITVGVGGCVIWTNRSYTLDLDIKFDNATHVAPAAACPFFFIRDRTTSGNIAPYRAVEWDGVDESESYFDSVFSPYQARTFTAQGTYPYKSSANGTKGVVRVCDENNDPTCAPQRVGPWY